MRTCGTCGNKYNMDAGEYNHKGTDKQRKHFFGIGSSDSKFLVDLINFLNEYQPENPALTIIQDLGDRNPMDMIEELERYEAEQYDNQMDMQ